MICASLRSAKCENHGYVYRDAGVGSQRSLGSKDEPHEGFRVGVQRSNEVKYALEAG